MTELTENDWRLLQGICSDHLRNYKVTVAERELCERIIQFVRSQS